MPSTSLALMCPNVRRMQNSAACRRRPTGCCHAQLEEQFVTARLCSEAGWVVCRGKGSDTRTLEKYAHASGDVWGGNEYILCIIYLCDLVHSACDSKHEEGSGGRGAACAKKKKQYIRLQFPLFETHTNIKVVVLHHLIMQFRVVVHYKMLALNLNRNAISSGIKWTDVRL